MNPIAEEICELDTETFSTVMRRLQESGLQTKGYQNGNISGSIAMPENGYLYTSVPFDQGFTLYVDGKKTEYQALLDTFIMVPLEKGIHEIKFTYYPTGFRFGLGVTAVTMLAILFFILRKYRTLKK